MTAVIKRATRKEVREVFTSCGVIPVEDGGSILRVLLSTVDMWRGEIDGKLVCMWGAMPSSLLSDRAYLWLWTADGLKGNEFSFVRHSQRALEEVLRVYPIISGHVLAGQGQSVRWLRWLGAKFFEPQGKFIPFQITAKGHMHEQEEVKDGQS